MANTGIRPGVWAAVVALLVAVLAFVTLGRPDRSAPEPETAAVAEVPEAAAPEREPGKPELLDARRSAHPAAPEAAPEEPVPYIDGLVYGEIDLREAKALMPDNLYWKLGSPTKDEKILAEREEEKKRRNEEYGRVLAGDASEDEVRAYYDYRRKLSEDYLEFSEFMARRYANHPRDEFVGMLELAVKMHADRLKQIPLELDDALERARERERIREDWRRQQEEFGEPYPNSDDDYDDEDER